MPDHARDAQSAAFREAGPDDHADVEQMLADGELLLTDDELHSPAAWNGWDRERVGPKSLDEARAALAARVDDPSAPDNDASAYDDGGEDADGRDQ